MWNVILVGTGGFIGTTLRYLIGLIPYKQSIDFPIKTLCINIIGSFLIGLIAAYTLKNHEFNQSLQLFLKVGVCGGFTTFSSFALETVQLADTGHVIYAVVYPCLSLALGILAVYLAGMLIR